LSREHFFDIFLLQGSKRDNELQPESENRTTR
jgi:hypothetical protein